ncbi:MAG: ABC transporter permease [Pseudomonadota bacterium]
MADWLFYNRATIAAVVIAILSVMFVVSIIIGRRQAALTDKDAVFGDPERTRGGWFWAMCGVASLLLVWFYFSWGVARAYFPTAANEKCQVAKLEESLAPIKSALPIGSRYYKSTLLVGRNLTQLDEIDAELSAFAFAFTESEQRTLREILADQRKVIANASDPARLAPESRAALAAVAGDIRSLADRLRAGPTPTMRPSTEALNQPKWGVTFVEIPLLPVTERGVLFDEVSVAAREPVRSFRRIRNLPPENVALIDSLKSRIDALKEAETPPGAPDTAADARARYLKSVERIFRRLDDGTIFPADSLEVVNAAVRDLDEARDSAQGGLNVIDALFMPGQGVVKSRTQCTEQGSARWLPKPTDVIATFARLANPDIEAGGGYKGFPLFWWRWMPIADVVGFMVPDGIADLWPGEYSQHASDGTITPNFKDRLLDFAQGDVDLGSIPMFAGHLWDSVFRVLVALALGIFLGVPLGLFMGVSQFFKSYFDPLIELYRPVPPLAWAPLILTIFGITDDGKVFLLFMVAFAIMVISARTGASGTQLSKIRASHSLGASNRQIMWNVILPNALPEILTGVRIAIGVCWGTLVAAEILAGTTGVGFIENIAQTVSDYELIWVTILIMGVLGLMFDLAMRWVIQRTIPWRGKG